ncbi:MAG: response regulator [Anaerolineae bacterium]|nr:response regulator [Anaerolineae bacterium]
MAQNRGSILVVDDDPTLRAGLKRILGSRGYAVETAGTAEEALVMLAHGPFDLVLTDLQMPGMDGMALLGEIKRRLPHTPVVMITAYGSMETVIQALRGGVSDFVTKPFRPDELVNIVEREIARQARKPVTAPPVVGLQLSVPQLEEISNLLAGLRAEIAARCVLLIEGTGHLIDAKGIIEDLNVAALATLVAGDFAATAGIASLIGEEDAFRLNYHEGERYSVYSAQVAPQVFLVIIFGPEIKLGSVLYYSKSTLARLREIIAEAPPAPPAPVAPVQEQAAAVVMEESHAPEAVYSLEEILQSGLLGDAALKALEAQLANLWTS